MIDHPPHILCFNPYARWSLHSARQATILHGLRLRGCSTAYVLCDGLMAECDMFQPAKGPGYVRNKMSCSLCQAGSASTLNKFGHTFYWLSRWLSPNIEKDAYAWAYSIAPERLMSAAFKTWSIGDWVRSSVHSHFRTEQLDFSDPDIVETFRRYLAAGYVMAHGVDTLLDAEQPDVLLLFNGRMAPTRIALEVAQQKNIRTITEERGFAPGYMRLVEDTHCLDPTPFYDLWQRWKETPLSEDECVQVGKLLSAHRAGSEFELSLFAAPTSGPDSVMNTLNLDRDRPVVSIFTSATDESACQAEAAGAFPSHKDWLLHTVETAKAMTDVQFVVRAHPNTAGKRALGTNTESATFITELANTAPANVKIVPPDADMSSFDLIAASDAGMVWHSSLGLEMAAMGKPVLRAGAYWFRDADFMTSLNAGDGLEASLRSLLTADGPEDQLARTIQAWRFAACWFFRQSLPFDLVRQPDWARGEFNFDSADALKPGSNASLDRVCFSVMNKTSLFEQLENRSPNLESQERNAVMRWLDQ